MRTSTYSGQLCAQVESVQSTLNARAVGFWKHEDRRLSLKCFIGAPDLPTEVGQKFQASAGEVGLELRELGIVKAVALRSVAVSLAGLLPVETGSGYWLRSFGAARSVAVPLEDSEGEIYAVFSAALPTIGPPDDDAVASLIRAHGDQILPELS